ncbi:MAG: lamin tail domain-containing protein, partial [Bacteroidetes bacterium]|nr:lamin tail domain-containing protein [Bacteroidota bacterium]
TMTSTGAEIGLGISYQWEVSTVGGGSGFSLASGGSGATTTTFTTGALTAGTYYYRLRVTCSNGPVSGYSNELVLTVNPTPTASASSNSPVCVGQALNLTGTTNIGTTFSWSGPNSFSSTSQSPSITGVTTAAAGTYTFAATLNGCTSAPATTSVTVNPSPSTVTVTPPAPTICAGSSIQLTASGGLVSGTAQSGTQANMNSAGVNAASDYPAPYQLYWGGQRMQMLILASELTSMGLQANTPIGSIAFPVVSIGASYTNNQSFKVSIGNTALTSLTSSFVGGLTEVVPAGTFTATVGYNNVHTFNAPFIWNGTSNVIVETTFSNNIAGTSAMNVVQYNSPTAFASSIVYRNDSQSPATVASATTASYSPYNARPDFRLGISQAGTFSWAASPELNTTVGPIVTATPAATNTYTVTATGTNGCATSANVTVTIGAGTPPSVNIAAAGPTTFCAGSSVALNSTVTDGCIPYTYSWSDGANQVATTPNYTATTSGTYTLTVTDNASQATASNSVVVTVNPTPIAIASSGTACLNGTLQLTGATDIGTTFNWTGPNSFASTDQNPTIASLAAANSGTYSFTATLNGCTSAPSNIAVTVNPAPVVSILPTPAMLCPGGTAILQANTASYPLSAVLNGLTANSASILSTIPNPSGFALDNGNTATSITDGCNDMFDGANQLNSNIGTLIPYTNSAILTSTKLGGGSYFTTMLGATTCGSAPSMFVWAGDLNGVGSLSITGNLGADGGGSQVGATFTVTANGITYDVFHSRVFGAGTDPSINHLFFIPQPNAASQTLGNTSDENHVISGLSGVSRFYYVLYAGASGSEITTPQAQVIAQAFANAIPGGAPAYVWSTSETTSAITVATADTYSVTSTVNGCSSTASYVLGVATPFTTAEITPAAPGYCPGGSVTLTATPSSGGAPYTYQWFDPTSAPAGTAQTQVANQPGVWTVNITDNCGTLVSVASAPVVAHPTPTASASSNSPVCQGQALNLTGTSDVGTTFSWTGPSGFTSTDQNPSIPSVLLSASGTYTLTATANGCTSTAATTAVTVNAAPIIQSVTATPSTICMGSNSQLNVAAVSAQPFVLITEVTQYRDGTGMTPSYPAFVVGQDFVELNNASSIAANVGGWSVSDYSSSSGTASHTVTFPSGTTIPPNGVLVVHLGSGTDSPADLFFNTGGSTDSRSSGDAVCYVLKNGSTVMDAVGTNGAIFAAGTGVTASDWSGSASAPSGFAGSVRTAPNDSNTGADWVSSGTQTQSIGTFNPGYINPNIAPLTGGSYAWTPATFLSNPNIQNPVATAVTATTTYTVQATDANGCSATGNTTVTIGVGTPPSVTISAGGPTTFCAGNSVLLSSAVLNGCAPITYSWSDGTNVVATTANYAATASGSYSVTVTDAANQTATSNAIAVTVNPLPNVAVTPPSGLICGTGSVSLTASGAVSYAWSPLGGLSGATGANVTANPTSTTTYTVSGTDGNSCVNTANVTVSVGAVPTVTANASALTVCENSTIDLTSTIQVNQTIFNENFNAPTNGWTLTNTSTGTNPPAGDWILREDGYVYGDSTFHSNDNTQFYLTNSDPIGSGASANTTLTSPPFSTVGFTSVTLSFHHNFRARLASAGNVELSTNGTTWTSVATYTGTDAGGTQHFVHATIPLTAAYIGQPSVQVRFHYTGGWDWWWGVDNVSVSGQASTGTFAWTSAPAGFTSSLQNPTAVVVTETTTYTVTATSALGCSNTASVTATVGTPTAPAVTINAGGSTSFCAGGSVVLSSALTGGCPSFTYSWSDGVSVVATTANYTATASGSYTLTVTDNNSMTAISNTIPVTVKPVPTASASASAGCLGQALNLTGTTNIGTSFSWAGPGGFSSTLQNPQVSASATAAMAGTYTFTATLNGCTSLPATVAVTMNPVPVVTIAPPSVSQCAGTAVLTASASSNAPLSAVLNGINTNSASILASIPSPGGWVMDGPGGVNGNLIDNGCDDMYDNPGNQINTNLGSALTYSDNTIVSNSALGTGGRYFTRVIGATTCGSSPTAFFWAGDINALTSISITGNLGADGSGSAEGSTFTITANGITYNVFLKRVFGTTDHSVNHLFLVPAPNSATHTFSSNTDNDLHTLSGLTGVTRFYYMLYASDNGVRIDDTQAQAIAQAFANAIPNATPAYVWNTSETTPAITVSTSNTYTVTATALGCSGTASANVTISTPVNAGTNGSTTVCSIDAPFSLFALLGGSPDAGGTWTGPTNAAHSATFNPATDAGGVYTYTVTAEAPCPTQTATVTVTRNVATAWYADVDGDGFGDPAVSQMACAQPSGYVANNTDQCPSDPNKRVPGQCGCGNPDTDTDGDGVADCVDNCPTVPGVVGTTCDDGDPNTINDVLTPSCTCAGTPVAPCPGGQNVALVLNTDNHGEQTSWEIIPQSGGAALCSGSNFASSSTILETCCLPNGCYILRVMDSFGDGMTTGGYVLRDATNKRIIDNAGNGGFNTLSQIANNNGFCLPLGPDRMMASSCDQMELTNASILRCEPNPAVQAQWLIGNLNDDGYEFHIFDPNGGYSRKITVTNANPNTGGPYGNTRSSYLKISSMVTLPVPQFKLLNIRVRSIVNGVAAEYGPVCRMKIDPSNACQTTQLTTIGNPAISCGAMNVQIGGGKLYANEVPGATTYLFQFAAPGYLRYITSPTRTLTLSYWYTLPLSCGTTYDVRVRASLDNGLTFCPFGATCQISTAPCARPGGRVETVDANELRMWPNPNRGDQLYLSMDAFNKPVDLVTVDITDMFGKRVMSETIAVSGGNLNTVLQLHDRLSGGVYIVDLTAGEQTISKRLVIQR